MQLISTLRGRQIAAVYGSGLLQGTSLILLPAAGTFVTDPMRHGLSSGEFGLLFVAQVLAAIVASASSARLAARLGSQRTLWLGLGADLTAMALLAASEAAPLPMLVAAAGLLGAGFGLAVSTLNAYAFELFRGREDAAVTGLHVTTGLGQVLAPLSLAVFDGIWTWWLAPAVVAVALAGMLRFQRCLPLRLAGESETGMLDAMPHLPRGVWLWAAIVLVYGALEAVFGNWSAIYLEQDAGFSPAQAATGLAVFWAAVTAGRAVYALASLRFPVRWLYVVAPLGAAIAFVALPAVGGFGGAAGVLILAGLGLSFLFPQSVSLASAAYPAHAAVVSGMLVAALMLGAGISAQVVGLVRAGVGLTAVFRIAAALALVMPVLAALLIRRAGTTAGSREPSEGQRTS